EAAENRPPFFVRSKKAAIMVFFRWNGFQLLASDSLGAKQACFPIGRNAEHFLFSSKCDIIPSETTGTRVCESRRFRFSMSSCSAQLHGILRQYTPEIKISVVFCLKPVGADEALPLFKIC